MVSSFVALKLFFHLRELRGSRATSPRPRRGGDGPRHRRPALHRHGGHAASRPMPGAAAACSSPQQWLALLIAVHRAGPAGRDRIAAAGGFPHGRPQPAAHSRGAAARSNQQLQHAAAHDALDRPAQPHADARIALTQAANLGQRQNTSFAVVVFDLDRFKADQRHARATRAGDELLRQCPGASARCCAARTPSAAHGRR